MIEIVALTIIVFLAAVLFVQFFLCAYADRIRSQCPVWRAQRDARAICRQACELVEKSNSGRKG